MADCDYGFITDLPVSSSSNDAVRAIIDKFILFLAVNRAWLHCDWLSHVYQYHGVPKAIGSVTRVRLHYGRHSVSRWALTQGFSTAYRPQTE